MRANPLLVASTTKRLPRSVPVVKQKWLSTCFVIQGFPVLLPLKMVVCDANL